MKSTKLSIVNSVVAGILICAMLAACGAVEKQSAAFSDGGSNLPVSEDMTESAAPSACAKQRNARDRSARYRSGGERAFGNLRARADGNRTRARGRTGFFRIRRGVDHSGYGGGAFGISL